jgi:hypothetical protein
MSTEQERERKAMRIGGQLTRRKVGDRASALLVGGRWVHAGEFRAVDVDTSDTEASVGRIVTHWVDPEGQVVDDRFVEGVWFLPSRMAPFKEALLDIRGRERCDGSEQVIDQEYLNHRDTDDVPHAEAWCWACEETVPVEDDGRGRPLSE